MQEIVIPTSYSPHLRKNVVSIILCCDTLGSLEAIAGSLPADVKIISQKVVKFLKQTCSWLNQPAH